MTNKERSNGWRISIQNQTEQVDEYMQKIKFLVWEVMEYVGEEMRSDDPGDGIKIICKTVNEAIKGYSPKTESFNDEFEEGFEDE